MKWIKWKKTWLFSLWGWTQDVEVKTGDKGCQKTWPQKRKYDSLATKVRAERKKKIRASASERCSHAFCPWPAGQVKGDSMTRSATAVTSRRQELSKLPIDMFHSQHLVSPHQLDLWESCLPVRASRPRCGCKDGELFPWQHKTLHSDHETWRYVALDDSYMMHERVSASFGQTTRGVWEFGALEVIKFDFFLNPIFGL